MKGQGSDPESTGYRGQLTPQHSPENHGRTEQRYPYRTASKHRSLLGPTAVRSGHPHGRGCAPPRHPAHHAPPERARHTSIHKPGLCASRRTAWRTLAGSGRECQTLPAGCMSAGMNAAISDQRLRQPKTGPLWKKSSGSTTPSFLNTLPSFMTKRTSRRALMSSSGLSAVAIMSAA